MMKNETFKNLLFSQIMANIGDTLYTIAVINTVYT